VVRSERADVILTTGLCTTGATVAYLRDHAPQSVTFVITGCHSGRPGDEDVACADYMEALLREETPDREAVVRRVWASRAAEKFRDEAMPEFHPHDVEYAVEVDRFDFAMQVRREGDLHVMEAVPRTETGW
jgi:2-phosphosulfolactate phosphatase